MSEQVTHTTDDKMVILCEFCSRKLRIPKRTCELKVKCPSCKHRFVYKNTWFNRLFKVSLSTRHYFLAGLLGGVGGFLLLELLSSLVLSNWSGLLSGPLSTALYAAVLSALLSAASSFYMKDWPRMQYGLKTGAVLGLLSGLAAGLIGQVVFDLILSVAGETPSLPWFVAARVIAWVVLGLLIGGAYGIKENTAGDLKSGLLGGAVGGLLGGLLFDPLVMLLPDVGGFLGRMIGFTVLGVAIAVAISRFREAALRQEKPEMYTPLSQRLPANPRLILPSKSADV